MGRMADEANTPQNASHHELLEDRIETVKVRRAPKYSVFLLLGAALGIIVALILTFAFDGTAEPTDQGVVYSSAQVFGFLALICVTVGVALGGGVALLLDRTVGRRTREISVDHETVHVVD